MNAPRLLECRSCGAPVRFGVPFCDYCRVPLTWGDTIPVERGAPLHSEQYPKAPLMGAGRLSSKQHQQVVNGHLVQVPGAHALHGISTFAVRNVCVAVDAIALDPHVALSVIVRAHTEGGFLDTYAAVVAPGFRSVRLSRTAEGPEVGAAVALHEWETTPVVRPIGEPNVVELRCADTMLQVHVNGVRVISAVDAGLGYGAFGWRVVSLESQGRAIVRSIEAFGTA